MTWLTYSTDAGSIGVHVPPVTPSAGAGRGTDSGGVSSLPSPPHPICVAHAYLQRVIDATPMPDDGVWTCEEMRH